MEQSLIPGPIYFFDQQSTRQRRKRTRKAEKSCKNPQPEANKKSTRAKSVSDAESAGDDDPSGESPAKARSDSPPGEANERGDGGNDDGRRAEAQPAAAAQEEGEEEDGEACGEASLLEEYRRAAPQLLAELERLLRSCAGREEDFFPRGLGNVLNYTWRELTGGAVYFARRQTVPSARKTVKQRKPKGSATSDKLSADTPLEKAVNAKKKTRKKTNMEEKLPQESTNLRRKSTVTNGHKSLASHLSTTISFSMSSEICLDQGWVVQSEDPPLGEPQWIAWCQLAVEKLQQAQITIKEQSSRLAEQGFTHALLLRHYGHAQRERGGGPRPGGGACLFPLYLRPSVPEPGQEEPAPKKLHYRINDGTSFLYYPSGHIAVCQSRSGLPCGGFYTLVFCDAPKASILATFTPFGHATISHPISGTVTVWDECGGVAYDPEGAVVREWAWPLDARHHKPIAVEVSELISVRGWSVISASLWFRADQERIQLPISSPPSVAPPTNLEEVRSWGVAPEPRKGRADQDLRRLRRTVRNILGEWLEHYRQATGISSPTPISPRDRPTRSAHSKRTSQSPAPPALGQVEPEEAKPARPPGGSGEELVTGRTESLGGRQGKEQSPHISDAGALRVHSNVRLQPVAIPRGPETGRPAAAPPCPSPWPCPALARAALRGQKEQQQCRCSNRRMPLLTDLEYDAFVGAQPPHTEQVLVVCVTPVAPPTGDILDLLYRAMNKNRSMPCTQCLQDSFRLVRYELPSADSASVTHNALLQQRNNIAPGMFLMYAGGRLLFADHIFNGYGCSTRDLRKQITETREAYHRGHSLPSDFRFSPPEEALTAEGGSTPPRGSRGGGGEGAQCHAPQTPLRWRERTPQTRDRAPAAQGAVTCLSFRRSLQQHTRSTLPVILPTEHSPQRAGPPTLAPGFVSGL